MRPIVPFASVLLVSLTAAADASQIRVACIGDSITYGARIDDREHHSYPARLQEHLGEEFLVENFGQSGATLRRGADQAYLEEQEYVEAVSFMPDVLVVQLGTNDTFLNRERPNWVSGHDFGADLRALVEPFERSCPDLRVLVLAPPRVASEAPGLTADAAAEVEAQKPRLVELRRALRFAAREEIRYEFVDLSLELTTEDYADGYHPTPFGADRIARRVATAIESEHETALSPEARATRNSNYAVQIGERLGYRMVAINTAGSTTNPIVIVEPEQALAGRPWILMRNSNGASAVVARHVLDRGAHVVFAIDIDPNSVRLLQLAVRRFGLGQVVTPGGVARNSGPGATVRAVLRAAGIEGSEAFPTTTPVSAVEYRDLAGWGEGRSWHEAAEDLRNAALESGPVDMLFLGGSSVQDLTGHEDRFARKGGERAFDRFADGRSAVNLGLSGDRIEHLLQRVKSGDLDLLSPSLIVVQAGLENLAQEGHTAEETADGLQAVIIALRERFPRATIVSTGPSLEGARTDRRTRRWVKALHLAMGQRTLPQDALHVNLAAWVKAPKGRSLAKRRGAAAQGGQDRWLEALASAIGETVSY